MYININEKNKLEIDLCLAMETYQYHNKNRINNYDELVKHIYEAKKVIFEKEDNVCNLDCVAYRNRVREKFEKNQNLLRGTKIFICVSSKIEPIKIRKETYNYFSIEYCIKFGKNSKMILKNIKSYYTTRIRKQVEYRFRYSIIADFMTGYIGGKFDLHNYKNMLCGVGEYINNIKYNTGTIFNLESDYEYEFVDRLKKWHKINKLKQIYYHEGI